MTLAAQLDLNHLSPPETASNDNDSNEDTDNKKQEEGEKGGDSGKAEVNAGNNMNTEKVGSPEGTGDKEGDGASPKKKEKRQTAFDQLVLPKGHKEMVLSLIAQHFRDKESASKESKETQQVDIVRGKGKDPELMRKTYANNVAGKGLIILLHGAPGVGKTTTAGQSLFSSLSPKAPFTD